MCSCRTRGFTVSRKILLICFITLLIPSILLYKNYKDVFDYITPIIFQPLNLEKKFLFEAEFYRDRSNFVLGQYSNKSMPTDILFIGDSHIQHLPTNRLKIKESINIGVAGQTTKGLKRLLTSSRLKIHPKKIVLLIGFNDLKYRPIEKTYIELQKIISLLTTYFRIKPQNTYVLSLLPVDAERKITNEKIKKVNDYLNLLCTNKNINFIDLHRLFIGDTDKKNYLYYTSDKVHLNMDGYMIFLQALEKHLGSNQ